MMAFDFNIIFWGVLVAFTLGAAVLAVAAVINVLRLRNVRLSWKSGKLGGYPLFSTLFLFSSFVVGSIAWHQGAMQQMMIAAFYTCLGFCWFTASYLATKRFITDNGIVKNVNEPSQTVAWHQIRDFVEHEGKNHTQYVFIYSMEETPMPDELIRLELEVPHDVEESFRKLISHKLRSRIRCYMKDDINVEQFNKL